MATPESKVKDFIKKFMKDNFPGAWYYSPPGTAFYGRNGTPDLLYFWRGVFIVIEAKAEGGHVTDLQMNTLKKLRDQGAVAAVVTGKDINRMNIIKRLVMEKLVFISYVKEETFGTKPSSEIKVLNAPTI